MAKKKRPTSKPPSSNIAPPKHRNIRQLVKSMVESEQYVASGHAKQRLDQREVTMKEVRSALLSGKRVASQDQFHTHNAKGLQINRWAYAFVKQGLDRKIKVCVSIDQSHLKPLLIVTVIVLG